MSKRWKGGRFAKKQFAYFVNLRMSQEMYHWLKDTSERDQTNISVIIRACIDNEMKKVEKQ